MQPIDRNKFLTTKVHSSVAESRCILWTHPGGKFRLALPCYQLLVVSARLVQISKTAVFTPCYHKDHCSAGLKAFIWGIPRGKRFKENPESKFMSSHAVSKYNQMLYGQVSTLVTDSTVISAKGRYCTPHAQLEYTILVESPLT